MSFSKRSRLKEEFEPIIHLSTTHGINLPRNSLTIHNVPCLPSDLRFLLLGPMLGPVRFRRKANTLESCGTFRTSLAIVKFVALRLAQYVMSRMPATMVVRDALN